MTASTLDRDTPMHAQRPRDRISRLGEPLPVRQSTTIRRSPTTRRSTRVPAARDRPTGRRDRRPGPGRRPRAVAGRWPWSATARWRTSPAPASTPSRTPTRSTGSARSPRRMTAALVHAAARRGPARPGRPARPAPARHRRSARVTPAPAARARSAACSASPTARGGSGTPAATSTTLLAGLTADKIALPAATARYHYSNLAYGLLGAVLERVTGESWADAASASGCSTRWA